MKFFTMGYGGTAPEQFISMLKEHHIETVADVRLWPHRASMGSYTLASSHEKGIEQLLMRNGIKYYSLVELGNLFVQLDDWRDRYRKLLACSGALLTERLLRMPERSCLLCSEKQPSDCHRLILGEFLERQGHSVEHLVATTVRPER